MNTLFTFHKTVRGYLHIKRDIPCEDYSLSYADPEQRYYIVAVADGHGDPACSRSAFGSRAVCEIALENLKVFAEAALADQHYERELSFSEMMELPKYSRLVIRQLTNSMISQWYDRVLTDVQAHPLTQEDIQAAGIYGPLYQAGEHLAHVYGTTLIAGLWLPGHLILLQQGDGRCDVFYADGTVEQPIPWDDRCFENVTTSMCDDDVFSRIRHCVIPLRDRPVAACYMGSDGVEDSYLYDPMEGTHVFYRQLSAELVRSGTDRIEQHLEDMLPGFSREGSGDDVSVSGIVCPAALEPLLPGFEALCLRYELEDSRRYYDMKIKSMMRKHGILQQRVEDARKHLDEHDAEIRQCRSKIEALQLQAEDLAEAIRTVKNEIEENSQLHERMNDAPDEGGNDDVMDLLKQKMPDVIRTIRDSMAAMHDQTKQKYRKLLHEQKKTADQIGDYQKRLDALQQARQTAEDAHRDILETYTQYDQLFRDFHRKRDEVQRQMDELLKQEYTVAAQQPDPAESEESAHE